MLVKFQASFNQLNSIEFYPQENLPEEKLEIERKRLAICEYWKEKIKENILQRRQKKQAQQERENSPFYKHHVSSANGRCYPAVDYIKKSMHDPSSFEHVETKISPLKDRSGWYKVTTKYRGKNMRGATILEETTIYVDVSGNVIKP
jgi:hypothetical protein